MLARLARWAYTHRRLVVLAWIGILAATVVASDRFAGESAMTFATPGAESTAAQRLLEDRFPERSGDRVELVFQSAGGVDRPEVRRQVDRLLADVRQVPHVVGIESPYAPEGRRQISGDGSIAYATVLLDVTAEQFPVEAAHRLIELAEGAATADVRFELSGFAIEAAEEVEFSSELIGIGVAVVILLVSFGSVLAMGLPVLIALFGLGIASGLIALLANVVETPDFAPQVAAMIGIGVGIDYVLFIVTRYRSTLHEGVEPLDAVVRSVTTSGRAVLFAGCTVIVSLLGLFLMNLSFLRGVAVAAISAVLVVMLASVTLLPAVLGFVGRTIDRLRVPFIGRREVGAATTLSFRWSRVVQRRPALAAGTCFVVLLALAAPVFGMRFGFPDAGNSPAAFTTRQAYDLLTEGFGPGFNGPLLLAVDARASGGPVDDADLAAVRSAVAATEGVAAVSPPSPSPDGTVALLVAVPATSPQAGETKELVQRLRTGVLPAATDGRDVEVLVGGAAAGAIDANDFVARKLPVFIGAVILASFLLLLVVFRSVLVPLKAAVMNLLSIAAAYGVVALAVQGGWFGSLFGIEEAVPVPSFIPMMMFAILFGLSMDYEVFLLSRIRESYLATGDNGTAVADGLAATARVITAAAAIMISVFLAFVLSDMVFLKMIGLGLATAIFVDASLVRLVVVPATMELLGDANWWLPGWLERRLPRLSVDGEPPVPVPEPALVD